MLNVYGPKHKAHCLPVLMQKQLNELRAASTISTLAADEGDRVRRVRSFAAGQQETRGERNAEERGSGERGKHGETKAAEKKKEVTPALRRYLRELQKELIRLREAEEGSRATSAPRTCPQMTSNTGGQGSRNNRGCGAPHGGRSRSRNPPGTQNCPPQSLRPHGGNEEHGGASQSSKSIVLLQPGSGQRSVWLYVKDFEQAMSTG